MNTPQNRKKVAIVVFATDAKGEVFQEDTHTIAIGRTWAHIRLRRALEPGAIAIIFNKESGNQAEFVMESRPADHEARLRLRDYTVDVWDMDTGEADEHAPDLRPQMHLECARCATLEIVGLEEYQIEALEKTGRLQRYCPECATDTEWSRPGEAKAQPAVSPPPAVAAAPVPAADPPPKAPAAPASTSAPPKPAVAPPAPAKPPAPRAAPTHSRPVPPAAMPPASRPVPPAAMPPAAARPVPPPPVPAAPAPPSAPPPVASPQMPQAPHAAPELNGAERRTSRRIYIKTRARIRRASASSAEVVEPVNVSRGGICFRSRASYDLDEVIWVAMHFREDEGDPLETPSRIVRVSPGADQGRSYGVQFL
jgi:hypothetical protein